MVSGDSAPKAQTGISTVDALAMVIKDCMMAQVLPDVTDSEREIAVARLDRVVTANPGAAAKLKEQDGALYDVSQTMLFIGDRILDAATELPILDE